MTSIRLYYKYEQCGYTAEAWRPHGARRHVVFSTELQM